MWLIFGPFILAVAVLIETASFFRNLYTEPEIENLGSCGNSNKAISIHGLSKLERVCKRFIRKLNRKCKELRAEGKGEDITQEDKSMVCSNDFFKSLTKETKLYEIINKVIYNNDVDKFIFNKATRKNELNPLYM